MTSLVLLGGVSHETNAFADNRTGLEAFSERCLFRGGEVPAALADTNTEMAGFLEAASAHGWTVRHTLAAAATPSGLVTATTLETFIGELLAAARRAPAPEAVLLFLHGAMVAETALDGDGEILKRIRGAVGPDVPIAATLDLHANVTDLMAASADLLVSYRTYPHVDLRERGREAGDLLERALRERPALGTVVVRGPVIDACNDGRTQGGPMRPLLARARRLELTPGIWTVSVNAGFADSDIPEAGPNVTVSGTLPAAELRAAAQGLMDEIWDRRDEKTVDYLSPPAAVRQACRVPAGPGPVVIADYADNPGAGAYGDATDLLRAMLEAGLENAAFGALKDPEAAAALTRAGLGAEVTLPIGGRTAPDQGGGPLMVSGRVVHLCDGGFVFEGPMFAGLRGSHGPSATLRIGGLDVLVTAGAGGQLLDLNMFRVGGIEPAETAVIGLKSMHHFRAAFEPIARAVLVCDSGAIASPDFRTRPFRHVRRPVYPLDPPEACLAAWPGYRAAGKGAAS